MMSHHETLNVRVESFETRIGTGYHIVQGHGHGQRRALAFFGNRLSKVEQIEAEFPTLKLMTVRQTHSDLLVESPYVGEPPEADAHWTRDFDVSLAIRTADCVPILLLDLQNSFAVAIHAGWRGVENEILIKTVQSLQARGFSPSNALAFIGPHIARESFEVGLDVAARLCTTLNRSAPHEVTNHRRNSFAEPKTFVDLNPIVSAQLQLLKITADRQHWLSTNTVTSLDHESYRRDRENSGRQISFTTLLSQDFSLEK